ncbi:MAG: hypothetical protein ACFB00_11850 [Parvularculaceae bacterium]
MFSKSSLSDFSEFSNDFEAQFTASGWASDNFLDETADRLSRGQGILPFTLNDQLTHLFKLALLENIRVGGECDVLFARFDACDISLG